MIFLGIDVGGSGIKAAPVNVETGELLSERFRIKTPKPATPKAVAKVIARLVKHFDYEGPIGCAFPARVKHGIVMSASNIDESWIETDAVRLFHETTGCPVTVLNDADAAGVAEMTFGAGRGRDELVLMLTFGTGIGSALFIEQILVPNTEFGHITVADMVGEHYAADSARKANKLTWPKWSRRVQEYLDRIEFLVGPDLIILGGGISKEKKKEKYFHRLKTRAELVTATLQNEAGIVGAACRAAQLTEKGMRA